jgi:hypothetical protein
MILPNQKLGRILHPTTAKVIQHHHTSGEINGIMPGTKNFQLNSELAEFMNKQDYYCRCYKRHINKFKALTPIQILVSQLQFFTTKSTAFWL